MAHDPGDLGDLGDRLRARGLRLTPQRERVVRAVAGLGHGTAEEVLAAVNADGGRPVPPSTVYRCLEALEASGAVRHTHLDHRSPSYQLVDHDSHVHLVCRHCGRVGEVDLAVLDGLQATIEGASGFEADLTHMAIHGRCSACRTS